MIRVAIIGTGNISLAHLEGYLAFPERCRVVAFCDIYPEKAERKMSEFGLDGVKVYSSHKDMLEREDFDLVSICTPPYTHAEMAIDFMKAGKDVLVEKPMAASLEECDQMLEAQKQTGRLLSVVAQNRFTNPVMKLKKVLDTGMAGRLLHAQVDSFWWRGHCYYDLWWRGSWEKEGGGCTLNHAVHHIDMLGWMMGLPRKITAVVSNVNHDNAEVEDISIAIMQYDKGALAQVTSSVIHHGEEQQIILQGEKARISTPWKVHASLSKANGFPQEERNQALEKELTDYYEQLQNLNYLGHVGQIEDLLTALERGTKPLVTGVDGRLTIEMITAIYKAGFTGETVELPLKTSDPFYTVQGIQSHVRHFYEKSGSIENLPDVGISVSGSDE